MKYEKNYFNVLILTVFISFALLSCNSNEFSNSNKSEVTNELSELNKNDKDYIPEIRFLKDEKENLAFLLNKTDRGFLKMFVFQTENIEKLNSLKNCHECSIEFLDESLFLKQNKKIKVVYTVNEIVYKKYVEKLGTNHVFLGFGISEHRGLFSIKKSKEKSVRFIDDVLINSNLSDELTLTAYYNKVDGSGPGNPNNDDCSSGGEGATSCSIDEDAVVAENGCSVTCGPGYYACCKASTVRCVCVAI